MPERPTFSKSDYERFCLNAEQATPWQANLTAVITRSGLGFEEFEAYIVGKSHDMMLDNADFATDGTLRSAEINISNLLECARTERIMKAHGYTADNSLGDNNDIGIDVDEYREKLCDKARRDADTPGVITSQEHNAIETEIAVLLSDYALYCDARTADQNFIAQLH